FPASVSSKPMGRNPKSEYRNPNLIRISIFGFRIWPSVMARDRPDGVDHLLVRDFLGGAQERRGLAVHQDGQAVLRVAAQGGDQVLALGLGQGAEVHGGDSSRAMERDTGDSAGRGGSPTARQARTTSGTRRRRRGPPADRPPAPPGPG